MPVLTRTLPEGEIGPARQPRDDVVVEAADGSDRFRAVQGPFARYERSLHTDPDGGVSERIDYELAPMVWSFPFAGLYRHALLSPGSRPWWAPPESPDRHAATALGSLCALAVVFSYIGTLLSQTITFAADEFDATKTQQGATLAAVRIGILGALALTALADRKGRRRVLLACAGLGCLVAALSSFAPDLVALGVAQTVVRGLATAGGLLVVVVAAEEMPSGSRAFAITLIGAAGRVRGRAVPHGPPARRPRRGRVARRHGGLAAPAARSCGSWPGTSPRAVATRRSTPRCTWPVTGAASGCSRRPPSCSSCSRPRRPS